MGKKREYVPKWVWPEYVILQYCGVGAFVLSLIATLIWHWLWPAIAISLIVILIGSYPSIKDWISYLDEDP